MTNITTTTTPDNHAGPSSLPASARSFTAPPDGLETHQHRSHLAPDHGRTASPPRRQLQMKPSTSSSALNLSAGADGHVFDSADDHRGRRRSRRRHRKKQYKKLLWVKQSYRDNYTDRATFLESLQRNPRLQPYQFWTLFADSTVIVQQVCAVVIFTACFSLILQERIQCLSVAAGGSLGTFLGWVIWMSWEWREQDAEEARREREEHQNQTASTWSSDAHPPTRSCPGGSATASKFSAHTCNNISRSKSTSNLAGASATSRAASGSESASAPASATTTFHQQRRRHGGRDRRRLSRRQTRWQNLVGTIKSSILIVFFVGAVSPILKSLTRSIASDSIWAMSSFLLLINLFFFDYSIGMGGGIQPATFSSSPTAAGLWSRSSSSPSGIVGGGGGGGPATTASAIAGMPRSGPAAFAVNSATMASTMLASRLPQTSQVFSLTIFSMEMFALFPIFRRYARHHSLAAHIILTSLLILGAGAGAAMAFGRPQESVRNAARGALVGALGSVLAMGGCSYLLISLQKYKNAIIGPWDPAKPVIITGPAALAARMHRYRED